MRDPTFIQPVTKYTNYCGYFYIKSLVLINSQRFTLVSDNWQVFKFLPFMPPGLGTPKSTIPIPFRGQRGPMVKRMGNIAVS